MLPALTLKERFKRISYNHFRAKELLLGISNQPVTISSEACFILLQLPHFSFKENWVKTDAYIIRSDSGSQDLERHHSLGK